MRPILYKSDEKVFDSYGLGEIDATKATATRERNGNYTLYLEYPAGQIMASLFKPDMRIKADAGVRTKNQTFIISRIVKDSSHLVKVYAKHISHLTEHMGLVDGVTVNGTARDALYLWSKSVLGGQQFDVWSDINTIGKTSWTVDKVKSARDALGGVEGSILDIWGGEYQFDNTTIRLHKQLGRKAPTVLEYGRNILSAEDDEDIESAYTSIYPYATYTPQSEGGGANDPVTVTLPEKVVDSDWLGLYADRRVLAVDLSSKFGEKDIPTADKLRNHAKAYVKVNRIGLPKTNTKVEYVDLAKTLDYADMAVMEEVELCDIVPIYYPSIGLTNDEGKVVAVNYDVLNDRNESIEVGMIGQSMRSAMASTVADRLDVLENRQAVLDSSIPAYLLSADGNKVWYSQPDNSKEHKVGDTWFEKNGEYNRIYIWNGEMWEKVMDSEVGIALLNDGIEQAKAKAEEEAQKLRDETNQKFTAFDKSFRESSAENQRQISQALQKVGANEVLANEAKAISSQVLADLKKVRQDAGTLSETVAQDIANFKSQVGSQLGGLATKVEVEQAEGRLTERFAQMKVGGRNYALGTSKPAKQNNWIYRLSPDAHSWQTNQPLYLSFDYQVSSSVKAFRVNRVVKFKDGTADQWDYTTNDAALGRQSIDTSQKKNGTYSQPFKWIGLRNGKTANDIKEIVFHINLESSSQGDVTLSRFKVETGTIATDWSPAPEDGEADITVAKAEFTRTAEGISAKLTAVESYVSKDGERSEALKRYSREETARQITAERSSVARDYVAKSSFTETVDGINRRFENVLAPVDGKIASKIAEYDNGIDGRFATITSQLSDKVNVTDFQRVRETSQLYERIIGGTEKDITDKVARMVMTNQLFQVEVGKYGSDGVNRALGTGADWTDFISRHSRSGVNLNADLHKVLSSGLAVGDNLHVSMEISIDDVVQHSNDSMRAVIQSYGDVTGWNGGRPFEYNLGTLTAGNNWRKVEFDVVMTADMLRNSYWMLNVRVDGARSYKVHTKALKIEKGKRASPWTPAPDDTAQAIKTVQSQLAGSWGVHNQNSIGQIISGFNLLGKNAGIKAETIRLEGQTLADKITAYEGRFNKLFVADGTFSKLNVGIIGANAITADKIVVNSQLAQKIVADRGVLNTLLAKEVISSYVQAVDLTANQIKSGILSALNGAMKIDLNKARIDFVKEATIEFSSANNAVVRRKGTHTAFIHFNDVPASEDGGVGSLYTSIGVTSSGDGVNSASEGRFAGIRCYRGSRGYSHDATVDKIEVIGDKVILKDGVTANRGFIFNTSSMDQGEYFDMVQVVRGLVSMWVHFGNGMTQDMVRNRSNASVNKSLNMMGIR